ncbi:MAG: DUF4445 domain-containing protein [Caldilineaceae bacterium]|nr:DUF4445 domain-containing protein [Caldilineaceae bacterium]
MTDRQSTITNSPAGSSVAGENGCARVIFQPNGRQGDIVPGTNLLDAARSLGVEIESICGGRQTCGKCKVFVEEGAFAKYDVVSAATHLSPAQEREIAYARRRDFPPNARLSCACNVTGDVVIRVPEESQARKQVVRKAAGVERAISVDAAMRIYYVELPPARLSDHRGDWERLRDELAAVHGLTDLRPDWRILPTLQSVLAAGDRCVTVTVFHAREVVRVQPGFHDALYGLAVDIGTTTVAGHLCNLRTGEILAHASRMNPQVVYGEDLMSRVSYGMLHADGAQRMHDVIIAGLNDLVADACADAGIEATDVIEMVAVGNTTMHHLLLGIDPVELGGAPFSLATHGALNVKARELGLALAPGANLYVPPCEAGHVGADNVSVLVAEAPYAQDKQMLVIDIGTNGEILLGNREQVLSASSPTGPAFEGAQIRHGMRAAPGAIERVRIDPATLAVRYRVIGDTEMVESQSPISESPVSQSPNRQSSIAPSGICGSGIIEAIAELFLAGVIGANGRFVEIAHPRLRTGLGEGGGKAEFVLAWPHETSTGSAITVHSDDIRAIQLGKAALYAGTKLLMLRKGPAKVDRIVLAGGFGSYIDPIHAMVLGLIPDCGEKQVQAVGNAAGDGARMMLLDQAKRTEAEWAARWVTYVDTAVEASFQDEFVAAIDIPHAADAFPHVVARLEQARAQWDDSRREAVAALSPDRRRQRTSRADRAARRAARQQRLEETNQK